MNDREKFLFDLQGFLVVEGVLSKAEVAAANEAIERHADGIVERVARRRCRAIPRRCKERRDAETWVGC